MQLEIHPCNFSYYDVEQIILSTSFKRPGLITEILINKSLLNSHNTGLLALAKNNKCPAHTIPCYELILCSLFVHRKLNQDLNIYKDAYLEKIKILHQIYQINSFTTPLSAEIPAKIVSYLYPKAQQNFLKCQEQQMLLQICKKI